MKNSGWKLALCLVCLAVPVRAEVAARAGDVVITREEVRAAAGGKLARLAAEEDRVRRDVLRELIEQRLLESEAKKRGVSVEALVAAEVDAKTAAVTDDEAAKRLEQIRQSRPDLAATPDAPQRVREQLRRERVVERRAEFVAELETKAGVRVLLESPRQTIETKGRPAQGPDGAPVTLVVFSDFQCPYCKRAAETLTEVQRLYADRARLVFRHFPLEMHDRAQQAAEAAECAGAQGKFWPMHDQLFADARKLSDADFLAYAEKAGLEREPFARCLAGGLARRAVEEDLRAGKALGVEGTPALYINGRLVTGARSVAALRRVIDEELARTATAIRAEKTQAPAR